MAVPAAALASALEELRALFGDRLTTAKALLERHGQDESYHLPHPPDAVVFAQSTAEVVAAVKVCVRHQLPITPFGVGTSLEGNIAALHGGLCIDMSTMNRVLEVSTEDMDVRVEAGVTRKQLAAHIKDTGLFFPVDPGADATLGGMAATRASGTTTVRYGTMRDNVLGLTIVLPDGSVVHTGTRARKSSAGYDLTRLFVGSEGTLGIITEVHLRLHSVPQSITAAVCPFPTIEAAVATAAQAIQMGIPVARIEFMDELEMRGVNGYAKLSYAEQPTLFFEFHGSDEGAKEQAEMVEAIAAEHGASQFEWAAKAEDRTRLWQARHNALYAAMSLRPGCRAMITDVCVPISKLAQCVVETRADIEATGVIAPMLGHVGDGNFHVLILIMPGDTAEIERAGALNDRLVKRALAMGGTCTGEHGIGYGKMDYLLSEQGDAVKLMRTIKNAIDPLGLMNPGKIFSLKDAA